jgi:hypothetical protein
MPLQRLYQRAGPGTAAVSPGAGFGTQRPGEARRNEDVIGGEVVDRGLAQPHERRVDATSQDVEHILNLSGLRGSITNQYVTLAIT